MRFEMETNLMEVRYYDTAKEIHLSAYADALLYDGQTANKTLIGLRIGGYPEMVNAIATAISGGGTITARTATELLDCTAEPKQYVKTQSLNGTYAVTTLLWDNDAARKAEEDEKKEEESETEDQQSTPVQNRCYMLCAPGDSDALYREIDARCVVPLLTTFRDYLISELQRRNILTRCVVQTTHAPIECWRLNRSPRDANIAKAVTDGLKAGAIVIPGAKPEHADVFRRLTGVTSYLNRFGPMIAARIRGQFRPLYDPAAETLSDEVSELNRFVTQTAGYSLYAAQLAAAEALKRRLQTDKFALLIAECRSGKSKIGSLALQAYFFSKRRKCLHLVLCPSHMTDKWVRELSETIPDSFAVMVQTPEDFDLLYAEYARGYKTAFAVLSKEAARDGYMRRPAVRWSRRKRAFVCPDCGRTVEMELLECGKKLTVPASPDYFRAETKANRKCPFCGSVLWTATHADEQSEWVRVSHLGYVHRRFVKQAWNACKTQAAREQIEALMRDPNCRTRARGASRRFSLSTYIKNKYTGRIDGLIADELHQYAANSGQGDSMGELFAASKKCIGMTATLINGYASGIFYLLYRVCAGLMQKDGQSYASPSGFGHEYGVEQTIYTVEEGAYNASRRTVKRGQRVKQLPGVSPLVYSRFLLENAVFLSLLDMGKELPEYEEIPVPLPLPETQMQAYQALEKEFKKILKDRSREMRRLAQKILPVYLNLLMAYPDQPYGHPPVAHPFDPDRVLVEPIDSGVPGELTEKDRQVLDLIRRKAAAGENVLLYVNWVRLDSRTRLLHALTGLGVRAEIMEETVTPRKREKWVQTRVRQGMQVLITNPNLVETGLDLNDFTTLVFYDIAFKLFTFRQASRRSWRINQTALRVEVYLFYYRNTMQERAVRLMASKLAVAGVIEGALTDEGLAAMSDCQDMATALARELAEGIRHEREVEDIAASFKKMAILHQGNEETQFAARSALCALSGSQRPVQHIPAGSVEQLSLWELAG